MRRRDLLAAWPAALPVPLLQGCGGTGPAPAPAPSPPAANPPPAAPTQASALAQRLATQLDRGINFGNMLDAPTEGAWGLRVEQRFIELVGTGGFTRAVRLPVRWSNHASTDAAAIIDPAFFARVDGIVDALLARGCTVMLNMHHYRALDGDPLDPGETGVAAADVQPRFLAMWRQIAARYANRGENLVFEPYNEPHGAIESQWNRLLGEVVAVIRQSNPTRVLVVGPTFWNNAIHLSRLQLPADPNLIVTIHHYEPFDFTHQGAEWINPRLPEGQDCCSADQLRRIAEPLDIATRWRQANGYPIVVGEFGAYSKAADPARRRYLAAMKEAFTQRQLPWMYWELAAGFGVYDPATSRFRPTTFEPLFGPIPA